MKSSRHLRQGPNGEFRHRLRRRIRDSVGAHGGFFARGLIREARCPATWDARPGLAEAIREALAVAKTAGEGPKSVLKVLRLPGLPESSTLTIGSLECFLRDVVAGLVSLISGTHEGYDFGDRRGLSRPRQSKPGGNS
jgi:hypothetical protein